MREIEDATKEDPELQQLRKCIVTANWTPEMRKYELIKEELTVVDGLLIRGTRIIIPKILQENILRLAHEGHLGIVGTKRRLRTKVWWKTIDKDAEKWVRTCHGCQITSLLDPPAPMTRNQLPEKPWQQVSIDYLGPLPTGHYLLVVVDYYSRYYEVEITRTMVAKDLISRMRVIFARFGIPEILISDNAGTFRDEEFKTFLEEHGTEHRFTTPLWPQANGEVERQNRSILKRLRIAQAEELPWKDELYSYLLAYRETPHSTTGIAPAELMFGRKIRSKLPEISNTRRQHLDEEMRDHDREKKEVGRRYADNRRNSRPSTIDRGDLVLVKQQKHNKLSTPFNPVPMKVIERKKDSVVFETPEGNQYERNTAFLKQYAERNSENQHSNAAETEQVLPIESPEKNKEDRYQDTCEQLTPKSFLPRTEVRSRERQATKKPGCLKNFVC